MGSVCGTIKEVVDEQRAKGKKVGLWRSILTGVPLRARLRGAEEYPEGGGIG
jgi:pyruvate/2-oxoacid:ferredoxin oxidoreductase alpha subunit